MRVLSGIQPSGQLHLGNYFGSIRPNLALLGHAQQNIFFIADLHALTTVHDASLLKSLRREVLLDYLACGFDPQKAIIFYQSDVPEHTELLWVLSTLTPMGLLERAVSYKDKVEKGIAATAGLFTYPVLMAADILLYGTTHVPVGKDQKQHLEIARDLAEKFNHTYGTTLTVPEPVIRDDSAVVPGTDGQKMSKSYGNIIPLFGTDAEIRKSVMGIVTDSLEPHEPKDPDSSTIFHIHRLFLDEAQTEALAQRYRDGIGYGDAKKALLADLLDHMAPLRAAREHWASQPKAVEEIAALGAKHARELAGHTMQAVRAATGLS